MCQPVQSSFTLIGNTLVFAVQQVLSCVLLTQNKSCFSGSVFSCLYFFSCYLCFFMLALLFSFSLLKLWTQLQNNHCAHIHCVCLYGFLFCLACIFICTPIGSVRWVDTFVFTNFYVEHINKTECHVIFHLLSFFKNNSIHSTFRQALHPNSRCPDPCLYFLVIIRVSYYSLLRF